MAQGVLHQIAQRLALGCVALFLSDGYSPYLTAIVTHFGHWVQPPQRQVRGPVPKLRWMPLPELLYAQVVKTMRQRRLVAVKHVDSLPSVMLARAVGKTLSSSCVRA